MSHHKNHTAVLDWLDYPFQEEHWYLPGKSRTYYHERLFKDSTRIFEPEENDFGLLRVYLDCPGKSKPGATHLLLEHGLPCST